MGPPRETVSDVPPTPPRQLEPPRDERREAAE
jgi:hypothetical protein